MPSTEAELVALADCAIELLCIIGVLSALGISIAEPIEVCMYNKGASDLFHRYKSNQHSRHADRNVFKIRELRSVGVVRPVPAHKNPAN